tara:strand:+ start:977 stop:1234 length:258 start_codon:yes stop_codon:yes gene_type:complete
MAGSNNNLVNVILMPALYVFLFCFIMLSPTTYKVTADLLPGVKMYNHQNSTPTDTGLFIHALVYTALMAYGIQQMVGVKNLIKKT